MMAKSPKTIVSETPDLPEIENFLYDEADCLDRADLEAWTGLYTEDGVYWMPQSPEQTDPETQISLFHDNRLLMEIRRLNFASPLAASMAYPVRASHIIGNIRIKNWDPKTAACRTTANFHAALLFRNEQTFYAGRYTHELRRLEGAWKIRHKRVDLINCDTPLKSLVIYL
jgi:3-phenylpropionate/cinnamic acid dioxygenase small subunit